MKQITKKDLLKKMARTLKTRKVESIKLSVHDFDTTICDKTIEFTNGDTLHLTYFDSVLYCYHFITSNYESDAYFHRYGGTYRHA